VSSRQRSYTIRRLRIAAHALADAGSKSTSTTLLGTAVSSAVNGRRIVAEVLRDSANCVDHSFHRGRLRIASGSLWRNPRAVMAVEFKVMARETDLSNSSDEREV
jgi:hypothetical protein